MSAVARHDATDLRRLAELGITPLHWRLSWQQNGGVQPRTLVVIHDDTGADAHSASRLLKDLLRGFKMAGLMPQARAKDALDDMPADAIVVSLGGEAVAQTNGNANVLARALPSLAELRGNAVSKRRAWAAIRAILLG